MTTPELRKAILTAVKTQGGFPAKGKTNVVAQIARLVFENEVCTPAEVGRVAKVLRNLESQNYLRLKKRKNLIMSVNAGPLLTKPKVKA